MAYYERQLHIDAALFKRSRAVMVKALQGGRALTRTQVAAVFKKAGIDQTGQGVGHLLMGAELDALICSGPRRGKQFPYMLLEERVPPTPALTRDEALAGLIKRYFTSPGPAQAQDFIWWSGPTAADMKKGLRLVGSRLSRETIDGKDFWFASYRPSCPLLAAVSAVPLLYKRRRGCWQLIALSGAYLLND